MHTAQKVSSPQPCCIQIANNPYSFPSFLYTFICVELLAQFPHDDRINSDRDSKKETTPTGQADARPYPRQEGRRTRKESLCCVHHTLQEQPHALRQGSLKSQPRHLARDISHAHRQGQPTHIGQIRAWRGKVHRSELGDHLVLTAQVSRQGGGHRPHIQPVV